MQGGADLAAAARLIANRARASMLDRLLDGRAHLAGELAREARVAPSTASGHLAELVDGGLIAVERVGRQRRYRLAGSHVADVLEALAPIAPPLAANSLNEVTAIERLREARTCYDHLSGRLGVAITDALVRRRAITPRDGGFELTLRGARSFEGIGVDVDGARRRKRGFALGCLDWTERRIHLAGALGAAVADRLLELGWVRRRPNGGRAVSVTPDGDVALLEWLGVELRG
jgi:DNA-binding transcriptional ArsR family regulator